MPRFPACLAETLRWEGSYSDDRFDPGGKTMKGIIQREYDAYRRSKGQPEQWVKLISDGEVTEIYHNSYWMPVRADEVFPGLDLELFDEAVNSGPVTAVKHLQQVLGMVADGHIGTQTLDAVRAATNREDLVEKYIERRRQYLKSLRTYWRFGRGWMDRCDGIEHAATTSCRGDNVHPIDAVIAEVPQPHSDPDTQSASQGRAVAPPPTPPVTTEATLAGTGTVSLFTAAPDIFADAASSGRLTAMSIGVALLKSKVFWAGMALMWGAIGTYLWRRKHHGL